MKENRKLLGIIAAVVIVVLVGAGLWFVMQNNKSTEVIDEVENVEEEIEEEVQEAALIGPIWSWNEFQDTAEVNDITVNTPEVYTVQLNEDGTANIQADCNQLVWTYTQEGSSLAFDTTGPSTLAFCGEDSLDTQFLEYLGNTATYVLDEEMEMLYFNLVADAGNMVFGL